MALGIRGANPIWLEVDLQGNLFDDTFYLFVLENTIPYIPAIVYHDPDLNVPWTNPIRFLGNGTLPVDIYFESDVVYRLEFRQGPTQADPLIYEVNNYVAGTGGSTPVDTVAFASSNQITNPQFALINFESPFTLSATDPDPISVAPGWFLDVAGTGTVTITQVPLNNANENPSNAPYALRLNLNGWTNDSVFLRQRFEQNGMLWANKFVSSTVTARLEGSPQNISADLVSSQPATLATVLSSTPVNEEWNEFPDYGELGDTTNPDTPPDAYIEYKLALPSNIDIYLTSFQLVVQDLPIKPSFEQDTIERQIDHTFHYYKPPLEYKPIPSYLVGWDFPFNPAQFGATQAASAIGANKSKYVWDQTIIFQSANSGVGVTRGTAGELVLTAAATTQMAVVQYLGATEARKILNAPICVNVSAKASLAKVASVSLWYTTDATLPVVSSGTNNSIVLTLDANGVPATQNGTWSEVPKIIGNKQITIDTNSTTNFNDYSLSGWDMEGIAACNTATFFAIVVGTTSVTSTGTVSFNSISLQSGSIATRPAPQTLDEVLRECQYYFEKSYGSSTTSLVNAKYAAMSTSYTDPGAVATAIPSILEIQYVQEKRSVTPTVTLYNPTTGTSNNVHVVMFVRSTLGGNQTNNADVAFTPTNWTVLSNGSKRITYNPVSTLPGLAPTASSGMLAASAGVNYHYDIDARLGVV